MIHFGMAVLYKCFGFAVRSCPSANVAYVRFLNITALLHVKGSNAAQCLMSLAPSALPPTTLQSSPYGCHYTQLTPLAFNVWGPE